MPIVERPYCYALEVLHFDRLVSARPFRVSIAWWFAHMPHLWHTRMLTALEARLAPYLARSRLTRCAIVIVVVVVVVMDVSVYSFTL